MSKPENPRRIRITEGPTTLDITEDRVIIQQAGTAIPFSNMADFLEFVNRVGILAVRLDQEMQRDTASSHTNDEDEGTPI